MKTSNMPPVVSDSSTLIHLASIGRINLLKEFYGELNIPPAVWHEVVEEGKGRTGASEVKKASESGWIKIVNPKDETLIRLLRGSLNGGEAEVIALAVEMRSAIVLLDESDARRIAEAFELPKTGVVGILIRARLEGMIISLRQELDKLRVEAGFWISDELCQKALAAVGEVV